MRPGQVFVVYRSAALSLAKSNMRRRQGGKDANSIADERICTKENCLKCCKKTTTFMFSRIGLFFVMMGYVALGGAIFLALESGNEKNMRRIMSHELNGTLLKLWNETLRINSFSENDKRGNFSFYATRELEGFEAKVIQHVQQGFDGRTTESENDWNFFGAVLYSVTLVSTIGYGHITTKTTYGKIATILYSAFGVPLMMLFVANIGSTMAKMFAFVFSRITMIFCGRLSNKKKKALILKNRLQLAEKINQPALLIESKLPIAAPHEHPPVLLKTNLKDSSSSKQTNPSSSVSNTSSITDVRQLPADVRLNMLTGVQTSSASRSLASSVNSIGGEKTKDALVRMNDLIRQNSIQDIEEKLDEEGDQQQRRRRRSTGVSPIQYYINETNKLTNNLDGSGQEKSMISVEKDQTSIANENHMKQVVTAEDSTVDDGKKSSKKNLKRSKSESTHNRRARKTVTTENDSTAPPAKPARRRFFSRKSGKLKKDLATEGENNSNSSPQQQSSTIEDPEKLSRKSQSFVERSPRVLSSSPPAYEQSTAKEITPSAPTVTWKGEHEVYPSNTVYDLTNMDMENEDDFDEDEEMSVPLLVTVFVIPLYLLLGAILFNAWEKWGFLNSFYFCFITVTTIGFGDFVPGAALNVKTEKEKLISAAVYILFGLVLIAMCVNLMKEQLSQKVKRVASKLGSF